MSSSPLDGLSGKHAFDRFGWEAAVALIGHSVPLNHGVATMKCSACVGEANGPTSRPACRSVDLFTFKEIGFSI